MKTTRVVKGDFWNLGGILKSNRVLSEVEMRTARVAFGKQLAKMDTPVFDPIENFLALREKLPKLTSKQIKNAIEKGRM